MAFVAEAVKWKSSQRDQFKSWIHHELHNCLSDRETLEAKWRKQLVQWRARVIADGLSDIPFVGASNVEMPLTAIHSDPVYADLMQTLHIPQQFWSVKGKRPDTVETANPIAELINLVEKTEIKMQMVNGKALLDTVIHGTSVLKDFILHDRRVVKDYNEEGKIEKQVKFEYRPAVQHVPLYDFFIPGYSSHIDPDAPVGAAPWVGHRYHIRKAAFKQKAAAKSPYIPTFDKQAAAIVELWDMDDPNENESKQREEDEFVPFEDRKITLFELHVRFDADGDGIEEDIVVDYHYETQQILRTTYARHIHGKRPFEAIRYMPTQGFYGIGVAEMDEWAQLAATDLLNETVNSAKLGNAVMLGVPYGGNFQADEPIYPGKIWPLGPGEKIQDIKFGQTNADMFNLLGNFIQFSEMRTGVPEMRQGNVGSLPDRTPASTILSVLNEGKKRFDMILNNMRSGAYKNIGVRMLQNIIQISKDDPKYMMMAREALGEVDAMKVVEVLQGPVRDIESAFGLSVTATSSQTNKELDKQNLVALGGVMAQLYQAKLQYDQFLIQLGLPEAQQMLLEDLISARTGTGELQRRILEAYDMQNPDSFIATPQDEAAQQQQQGPAGANGAMPGIPPELLALLQAQQPVTQFNP